LNRISTSTVGNDKTTLTYEINGNIKTNSKMGTYTYGTSSAPHRVTEVSGGAGGTRKYTYDKNGTVLTATKGSKKTTISYTSFNKPLVLNDADSGKKYTWTYGSGLQIIEKVVGSDTIYYGEMWENEVQSHMNLYREYLGVNFAVLTDVNSGIVSYKAILRDHLGSVDVVVDLGTRGIVDQRSYSLTGKPRNPQTWSATYTPVASSNVTQAGFTNQLGLEKEALVHMGGRMYDSDIMRFYSADPYGPPVGNMQGLNKYSYVANRPLSDTDPTGYHHHHHGFWHKFGKWCLKITKWAIDAALLIVCEGPECAAAFNAAYKVVKDKIEGESWKASLFDGFATFMTWEIAGGISKEMDADEVFARHVACGLIEGADAKVQGGSFAQGFIQGFHFNPYDNVFLKDDSAAWDVHWESKEKLEEKLSHKVEKTIAHQLGIPTPLVHAAHELVEGSTSGIHLPKLSNALSKLPSLSSLSLPSISGIRPFDLIDGFSLSMGSISLSGVQSLMMSGVDYLNVLIDQGPPEITAIIDVGFFRGTVPFDGVPEDLPFGIPGGNPFLGGYINVQFAPLGISVQADARISPGQASWGVFAGSNDYNAFVPIKKGGTGQMWGQGSPTSKQKNN
jgi:RHS repeat-associated protein